MPSLPMGPVQTLLELPRGPCTQPFGRGPESHPWVIGSLWGLFYGRVITRVFRVITQKTRFFSTFFPFWGRVFSSPGYNRKDLGYEGQGPLASLFVLTVM